MLSVTGSRELQAATLALKAADRGLRSEINRATVQTMNPVWRTEVAAKARTAMDTRMLVVGARIKGGNPPAAVAANSTRGISGSKRYTPGRNWQGWEFGVENPNAFSRYTRKSKNGGTHSVERRTMRHLPRRTRKGRVIYPAFAEVAPRMVSLWVQLIVKKYHDAAEGK